MSITTVTTAGRAPFAATTTAWGFGDPLDVVLDRIENESPDSRVVELAIGARPPDSIEETLAAHSYTYIAHHNGPIVSAGWRPHQVGRVLAQHGISTYSAHPPKIGDDLRKWCSDWVEGLSHWGVTFSVETMYPIRRGNNEPLRHLATPASVEAFTQFADMIGWSKPLLIDISHLHIGWVAGEWSESDICDLLGAGVASELHISSNNGQRDEHRPIAPSDITWRWAEPYFDRFEIVVDEGKRRPASTA